MNKIKIILLCSLACGTAQASSSNSLTRFNIVSQINTTEQEAGPVLRPFCQAFAKNVLRGVIIVGGTTGLAVAYKGRDVLSSPFYKGILAGETLGMGLATTYSLWKSKELEKRYSNTINNIKSAQAIAAQKALEAMHILNTNRSKANEVIIEVLTGTFNIRSMINMHPKFSLNGTEFTCYLPNEFNDIEENSAGRIVDAICKYNLEGNPGSLDQEALLNEIQNTFPAAYDETVNKISEAVLAQIKSPERIDSSDLFSHRGALSGFVTITGVAAAYTAWILWFRK